MKFDSRLIPCDNSTLSPSSGQRWVLTIRSKQLYGAVIQVILGSSFSFILISAKRGDHPTAGVYLFVEQVLFEGLCIIAWRRYAFPECFSTFVLQNSLNMFSCPKTMWDELILMCQTGFIKYNINHQPSGHSPVFMLALLNSAGKECRAGSRKL